MTRDLSKLDLAFVLDTTSSMGSYIEQAKKNIQIICDDIVKSEKCHLRIGLVNYRDHPPQDSTYITSINDLTDKIDDARKFISNTTAYGGGDLPEAVCCALNDCLFKLTWRDEAIKICILIADSPPHGFICSGDGFPNGCPLANDPAEIAHKMAEKGITIYTVGCEPSLLSYRSFFIAISLLTGGKYISLNNAENLAKVIIGNTREEVSMEKLMAQVQNELMKEAAEKGTKINEDELTKRVQQVLNNEISQVKNSSDSSLEITDELKEMSKLKTLKEMNDFAKKHSSLTCNSGLVNSSLSLFGTSCAFIGRGKVKKSKTTKRNSRKSIRLGISSSCTKSIREYVKLNGVRRSPRLNKNTSYSSSHTPETRTRAAKRKLNKLKSIDETNKKMKKDSIEEKTDDVNEIELRARRLVKKAIARSKLY